MKQKWLLISEMQIIQHWQCRKKQSFNSIYYTLRDRTGTEELARGKPYCNDIFYKNLFMYLSYFSQASNITVYVHLSELKQLNLFKKYCMDSNALTMGG